MRKLVFGLFFSVCCWAQQQEKSAIMQSGEYYYGSGISTNIEEARDHALSELTQQIAVQVSSSFERVIVERDQKFQEKVESIIKTHALATLENVQETHQQLSGNRFEVFCYLRKTDVAKIFAERKRLIAEITAKADLLTLEMNLAHALKYYYFAAILLNSLPDQNIQYEGVNYTTAIPLRINRILSGVAFHFVSANDISNQEREVTLRLSFHDKPVATLDLNFWDGSSQVTVCGRDGQATFRLFGGSTHFTEIKMQPKYAYYEARDEIQTVSMLWPLVVKPEFNASQNVRLSTDEKDAVLVKSVSIQENTTVGSTVVQTLIQSTKSGDFNVKLDFKEELPVAPIIIAEVQDFLNTIATGDPAVGRRFYRNDSFLAEKMADYLLYNHPQPLDQNVTASLDKTSLGWELRRIRVLHRYPSLHKQSTEYLTIDFTPEGKICDFNVCITENLYQRFVKEATYGADWNNRQQIIKFLEKYRTAYLTRDLPTVDMMFADDAIIIIGRRLERRKLPDQTVQYEKMAAQPDYEYLRFSKEQYLQRQRQIFAANQDIALDFSTFNIIKKNDKDSVYGVEMRQNYVSTTYADEGYLFLLVDFRDKDPLIYVRA